MTPPREKPGNAPQSKEMQKRGFLGVMHEENSNEPKVHDAGAFRALIFGCAGAIAGIAQTMFHGVARVRSRFILTMAANSLAGMRCAQASGSGSVSPFYGHAGL